MSDDTRDTSEDMRKEEAKETSGREFDVFDRETFQTSGLISVIGTGSIGGKANGLAFIKDSLLPRVEDSLFPNISMNIPRMTVLATSIFDKFMERNKLYEIVEECPRDETIADAFIKASLPEEIVGDIRTLSDKISKPLAIRSSSLFEDTMREPFAGVYATKMIPNNQKEPDRRFKTLADSIKYVYASTFFLEAREYIRTTELDSGQEKMAVIIQEVVGEQRENRFYPAISGVVRSYNFYPTGHAKAEDGVVNLALGLGKTIVDGGKSWSYSPAYPKANPPYKSVDSMLKQTQTEFWAINLSKPAYYNPLDETEFLVQLTLGIAEEDGTLKFVASSYNPDNDRISPGLVGHGPRIVNFAPILKLNDIPLNAMLRYLLKLCEESIGHEVEIEFAVTVDPDNQRSAKFHLLQVRPMFVSHTRVEVTEEDFERSDLLAASERVLGNGIINTIRDVIYVKPQRFDEKQAYVIASELEKLNHHLAVEGHPYMLIAFGRLGTTDPPAGIPVAWWQISGAKVIVETTFPGMSIEPSQGSHFFHNVISSQVGYFSIPQSAAHPIDWDWLNAQEVVAETEFVRYAKLSAPLRIKIDGRMGRGIIMT